MPDLKSFGRKWDSMSYENRVKHVQRLAKRLFKKHLNTLWVLKINTRCTNACGFCDLDNRTIELSDWLIAKNPMYPLVYDILLHEIAHAISDKKHKNERHHHNKKWKAIFEGLGGSGRDAYPEVKN